MGFANYQTLVDAYNAGQIQYSTWRKTPSQTATAGIWMDFSMVPGNPVPNYYAASPQIADTLDGTKGMFHGGAVFPQTKHLKSITAYTVTATAVPIVLELCDYLLYYPFLDMSTTDVQIMDNTVSLPRYSNGNGVQIIAVQVAPQATGGSTFQVGYTNSLGVSGRTSKTVRCNTSTSIGSLIQTNTATVGGNGPFIPLQNGDSGVRSIDSITFNTTDTGLITLVLVKPLASMMIRGIDAPVEVDFSKDRMSLPRIYDGAYLNFIGMPNANLAAAPIFGDITFVWS